MERLRILFDRLKPTFMFCVLFWHLQLQTLGDLVVATDHATLLLQGESIDDDGTVQVNTLQDFGGKFYGNSVGAITVAENGNLNFSSNGFFNPLPLTQLNSVNPNAVARIAPLWDDVFLFQPSSNAVLLNRSVGQYLAVTWKDVSLTNDLPANMDISPPRLSFQAVWFESAITIRGFNFLADDIAFGYQDQSPGNVGNATLYSTVGITHGNGRYTALPGDSDGYITSDVMNSSVPNQIELLAWGNDAFLLFRPKSDPTMGYNSSLENMVAVPEPSAFLFAIAAGSCVYRRLRKNYPR